MNEKIAKMKLAKSPGHLEMLAPKHVKRAAKPVLTDGQITERKLLSAQRREEKKDLQAAMAKGIKDLMLQMAMMPSPFSVHMGRVAPSSFGNWGGLGGAVLGSDFAAPPSPPVDLAQLESLKMIAPRKIERVIEKPCPDYVEVITGWRAWNVIHPGEGLRLRSLGQDDIWEPRQQKNATCRAPAYIFSSYFMGEPMARHTAPEMDCECGIWAFKSLDNLVAALGRYQDVKVLGQVSLWGKVVETENGFRAEHGYPSELWLVGPANLEDLSWIYGVPVRSVVGGTPL